MKAFIKLFFLISVNICNLGIVQAATNCDVVTEIPSAECKALLELYNGTNGSNWRKNEGWNKTNTPCNWHGIACKNKGVIEIGSLIKDTVSEISSLSFNN